MIKGVSTPITEFLMEKSKTEHCLKKASRGFAVKIDNGLTLAHR
jgi:hypothetical protein